MKILVVRFKQIGDSILASSMCNTLRETFPDAQIDYVLYEHVVPIFKNHKNIDNIISISKKEQKNLFKYIKKVWDITRTKYDIVIDIMSTPKSELFTLFSPNAKYKIGRKKKRRGYTYTHKIEEAKDAKDKVDKFLKMLKPLEKEYDVKYVRDFSINITEDEKEYLKEKMEKAGVDFTKPVFACSVTTRVPSKLYPVDNMVKIIKTLLNDIKELQIVFYYAPDQKEFVTSVHRELLDNDKRIFSNIQTASIRELAMLLKNCDMFFGNEGGPRHLAQALDIPSYAIYFPESDKKEWLPYTNDKHQGIISGELGKQEEGMTRDEFYRLITPEIVVNGVEKLYNEFIKIED